MAGFVPMSLPNRQEEYFHIEDLTSKSLICPSGCKQPAGICARPSWQQGHSDGGG
jgi:hypothetical protein